MRVLGSDGLRGAADARRSFVVYAEPGTTLADIKDRKYWGQVAPQLTVGDRIEVQGEGGTFFADLFVRDIGQTWAEMAVHRESEHPPIADIMADLSDFSREYEIRFMLMHGHCVIRLKDNTVMFSGKTPEEARQWAVARVRR